MHPSQNLTHLQLSGLNRRELLQAGYTGFLGIGLASVFRQRACGAEYVPSVAHPVRRAKSVIIVFLTGAPSHLDTFDMKPDAPAEIRGEFRTIPTKLPGLHVCEHLPRLAARTHQYALVRSLSHKDNNHLMSTHHVLTGHVQPGGFFDKVASRDDWPCYSAALDYLRPRSDGIPNGINLPTFLLEGPLTWPGQHAGFLGPRHDPWQITRDPNAPDFRIDNLRPAPGLDIDRLGDRRALLQQVDQQQRDLAQLAECRRLSDQQQLAFSVLTSGKVAQAFDLNREPAAVRDRYGRHSFGQSLLLARRLVQAGVPVVQANMGHVQNWDSHADIFPTLKGRLLPPLDQGVAALLDDLEASGLLAETMVLMLGEFGRTPKITKLPGGGQPGRDHWGPCFFAVFAGAGVRGGQVIGKSDRIGAYPITNPYPPDDVGATVYAALGIDPGSEVRDRLGRPTQLNHGRPIDVLFAG
jgi:hypothetical protein